MTYIPTPEQIEASHRMDVERRERCAVILERYAKKEQKIRGEQDFLEKKKRAEKVKEWMEG